MSMNKLAEMVQAQLLDAIEKDDLVLPTLPEVALSIREAAEDSEISVAALSRVIGRDAGLRECVVLPGASIPDGGLVVGGLVADSAALARAWDEPARSGAPAARSGTDG